jgi:hypothetical protein
MSPDPFSGAFGSTKQEMEINGKHEKISMEHTPKYEWKCMENTRQIAMENTTQKNRFQKKKRGKTQKKKDTPCNVFISSSCVLLSFYDDDIFAKHFCVRAKKNPKKKKK